jgi:hypothetical protein
MEHEPGTEFALCLLPQLANGGDTMTGLEALQSVQYVTVQGRRLAVVGLDEWETMVEWLENLEDIHIGVRAYDELKAAGGNRERAGWLKWDEIKTDLP